MINFNSVDSDWINYEAVVSTSIDQTALAPGELQKEWSEGNRRYFHYKMPGKFLKQLPFISAKYNEKKDRWQDKRIEIYYHEDHNYHVNRMINALKKSLEYFETNFSPYQFDHIKVVELPKYQAVQGQACPGMILISEGLGFIARIENDVVDFIFRAMAHELSHQWWGKQVIGADVQGWRVMTEVLAQYSALMVLKRESNQEVINNYVKWELDRYLKGRAEETREETPLLFVDPYSNYIIYAKGLVVINAVQDYIGEDNLNAALKKYIQQVAFQEAPYTTSLEFLDFLKAATPDSLQYIYTDMFENITLYDNKAVKASYDKLDNGLYSVKLRIETAKIRSDGHGNEQAVGIRDYITFGVFGAEGEELYLKKHFINTNKAELEFIVNELPERAGIDPYYFLVDRNVENNVIKVEKD
jgi:aminopeptidase N